MIEEPFKIQHSCPLPLIGFPWGFVSTHCIGAILAPLHVRIQDRFELAIALPTCKKGIRLTRIASLPIEVFSIPTSICTVCGSVGLKFETIDACCVAVLPM